MLRYLFQLLLSQILVRHPYDISLSTSRSTLPPLNKNKMSAIPLFEAISLHRPTGQIGCNPLTAEIKISYFEDFCPTGLRKSSLERRFDICLIISCLPLLEGDLTHP